MKRNKGINKILLKKDYLYIRGFTLIEVMVVLAIISIIAVMSLSSWQSFSDSAALGDTAKMIEAKIKLAKSYSLSALNDKKYGIRFEADKATLFLVNADDTVADVEAYNLTDGVEIYDIAMIGTGGDETCNNNGVMDNGEIGVDCGGGGCSTCISNLVFNRLTGTSNKGTFGIRMIARPDKTKIITINAQGQTGTNSFEASAVPPIVEDTANNINARHIHFNLAGWAIQDSATTANLIFRKNDGIPGTLIGAEIDTDAFFSAGIFNWQGSIDIDGVAQQLRIHTLDTGGAVLCVIRDRMQNSKDLKISFFNGGAEKGVAVYAEDAVNDTVTVTPDILYVSSMDAQ